MDSPGGNNIQGPPSIDHSNGGLNLQEALQQVDIDLRKKTLKEAPKPGGGKKRRRKSRRKSRKSKRKSRKGKKKRKTRRKKRSRRRRR